jgi:hypothetical protein
VPLEALDERVQDVGDEERDQERVEDVREEVAEDEDRERRDAEDDGAVGEELAPEPDVAAVARTEEPERRDPPLAGRGFGRVRRRLGRDGAAADERRDEAPGRRALGLGGGGRTPRGDRGGLRRCGFLLRAQVLDP